MKPSEVLDTAANIIVRDGWYQGAYYKEAEEATVADDLRAAGTAPCCQAGAIGRAVSGVAWYPYTPSTSLTEEQVLMEDAERFMIRYVRTTFGVSSPIDWNDQPGTTAGQVVEALRGAARMARAEDR